MANQMLTQDQITALAQVFHDIAAAIGDFRIANARTLSDSEQAKLQNQQFQCLQYSTNFITMGIAMEQADLDATVQQIESVTAQAQEAIETIQLTDKVLQIATAAAVLGASIASLNTSAIGNGIQGLITAIDG